MDVDFPYKEAITNAYGQPLPPMSWRKKPKVNHPYFMVKQVFEAVQFDKRFNQITEELQK